MELQNVVVRDVIATVL